MINIDPAMMKIAERLNGTVINGYAGYYEVITGDEGRFFIIAIPLDRMCVGHVLNAIDRKE
jgi:hypothetical protein